MATRLAFRAVAHRPPPLPIARPPPHLLPSTRRWASSSSVKQKLRHPSQMGASDLFVVACMVGGVAYLGTVFGRAGDERRGKLQKEVPAAPQTPAVVDKKASEAAETILPPSKPSAALPPEGLTAPSPPSDTDSDDEEDASQAAFNPETGEINWDCPCLGGMAHGPCGEEFKAAFSCFVYSEEEPKGVECIEKFRSMQECFRAHPDVYGEESAEDEDEDPHASPSPSSDSKDDFVLVERSEGSGDDTIEARAERALGRGR